MTIEEINALTVLDVEEELLLRLGLEVNPDDGTLEAELVIYKQELIDAENARIAAEIERQRREDWKNRFESIKDLRAVLNDLGYKPSNMKIWARNIIDSKDETLLLEVEAQAPTTDAAIAQYIADENQAELNKEAAIAILKALKWSEVTTVQHMKNLLKEVLKVLLK